MRPNLKAWLEQVPKDQRSGRVCVDGLLPVTKRFVNPSSLDCELTNRLKRSFVKPDEVACQAVHSIG